MSSSLNAATFNQALPGALKRLDPRVQWKNPVMFIVWVGAVLTLIIAISDAISGGSAAPKSFDWLITAWLWFTVIFANLAESIAEGRGKAQAQALRNTRKATTARKVRTYDEANDPDARACEIDDINSAELKIGDVVVVSEGQVIPGDGDIVCGIASVDESAITGESAPVVRSFGGDNSAVTGGTRVLSDRIVVKITAQPGASFVDRMIALVEGANRQKTPNEIALNILLASLSIVFVMVVLTLNPMASYPGAPVAIPVLIALLVCLIPTTIGALLSAIGIAGMDRLVQHNVLATSGRAVEAAGDVSTLLLDKTGTITYGNRQATAFHPLTGVSEDKLRYAAAMSSLSDTTPEGTSIVDLAGKQGVTAEFPDGATAVPFTAQTRMSGLDLRDGSEIRKGAASAVAKWSGEDNDELRSIVEAISRNGSTPLVVAVHDAGQPKAELLGAVELSDVIKDGLPQKFAEMREMGIRTVMITGDNKVTAQAIAEKAGVDDVLAEATPEDKLGYMKAEQAKGQIVAMTGDGTNDAPALAQADVGVAMNTGTSAAKEAGNMVDLDSDPAKLIDIVAIGKQLLMTRGALTTFSIANDIAKYFAIIPAVFAGTFPALNALNVMHLHSPSSAVVSALIFNALIIVALIPLALKGVAFKPMSAMQALRRNLTIYGLGGIIAPFIGIWLIDLLVRLIPGF